MGRYSSPSLDGRTVPCYTGSCRPPQGDGAGRRAEVLTKGAFFSVPRSQLNINFFDRVVIEDPVPVYEQVRRAGRVAWNETLGVWMLTGFDDCTRVLVDDGSRFAMVMRRAGGILTSSISGASRSPIMEWVFGPHLCLGAHLARPHHRRVQRRSAALARSGPGVLHQVMSSRLEAGAVLSRIRSDRDCAGPKQSSRMARINSGSRKWGTSDDLAQHADLPEADRPGGFR